MLVARLLQPLLLQLMPDSTRSQMKLEALPVRLLLQGPEERRPQMLMQRAWWKLMVRWAQELQHQIELLSLPHIVCSSLRTPCSTPSRSHNPQHSWALLLAQLQQEAHSGLSAEPAPMDL